VRAKGKTKSAERKDSGPSIRKVSAEAMQQALNAASAGVSDASVAAFLGVSPGTMALWVLRSDDPLGYPLDADLYRDFAQKLALARAKHETSLAATVLAGARGGQQLPDANKTKPDPDLALRILQGRYRKTWAPRDQALELSAGDGGAVGIQIMLPKLNTDTTPDGRHSR
jgi:hypothetical protein